MVVLFVKQKTAYEMRISGWSSDVCSSDLEGAMRAAAGWGQQLRAHVVAREVVDRRVALLEQQQRAGAVGDGFAGELHAHPLLRGCDLYAIVGALGETRGTVARGIVTGGAVVRSEEHTSELQSLIRLSFAVFCLNKKHR